MGSSPPPALSPSQGPLSRRLVFPSTWSVTANKEARRHGQADEGGQTWCISNHTLCEPREMLLAPLKLIDVPFFDHLRQFPKLRARQCPLWTHLYVEVLT